MLPACLRGGLPNKFSGRPTTFGAALETENFLKMALSVPSFPSGSSNCKGQRANYVPQSGEITRILKEMDDEMGRDSVEEETLVKKYEERTGAMQSGQRLLFQLQHTKDFFKKIVCVWGNWVP